jgi:hypothetical protein
MPLKQQTERIPKHIHNGSDAPAVDLSKQRGAPVFRVMSEVPTAADFIEGQMILYENSGTIRTYFMINSTVRYVDLT